MSVQTAGALVRAGWGLALFTAPRRLLSVAGHPRAARAARFVVRTLGARHLVQAAVVLSKPSLTRTGGVADALHAISAVAFAAASPRWRLAAGCDALLAAGFGFLSWRYPTQLGGAPPLFAERSKRIAAHQRTAPRGRRVVNERLPAH